ncbi:TUDOR-SN protein 1 [Actinidia rufa]|uniref:TUDOR-SN protein 1 n=1 Tax=Actinidia rufa TaxID=165716 RepID=A0A7J0E3G7_9ERIC|nr:TUDOR-SN protein 1 [Actinidia rufa]
MIPSLSQSQWNLTPSAIGDSSNFDAMGLLASKEGSPMHAIVEQVCDGSTLRVCLLQTFNLLKCLLPESRHHQWEEGHHRKLLFIPEISSDELNGEVSTKVHAPLTSEQRLEASSGSTTEVRIVLESVDKFSNLIGSVYYPDGELAKDLALELIENCKLDEGLGQAAAEVCRTSGKKTRLRYWTNYVPPATNSKAVQDQNFTGKVVEVVSGNCVITDDSVPYGSPLAELRVNLSSIRCLKIGKLRRDEKPAPYAREAKEFLRTRLIGRQVGMMDSQCCSWSARFKGDEFRISVPGISNIEILRKDQTTTMPFSSESRVIAGKKGIHSSKDSPAMHIADLTTASAKKTKDFLPFMQQKRLPAVVEYVLSGHWFLLFVPRETCSIAFSFSGVRCPGRDDPLSNETIALMRQKIMQRIEVETVDRTGTFLGSMIELELSGQLHFWKLALQSFKLPLALIGSRTLTFLRRSWIINFKGIAAKVILSIHDSLGVFDFGMQELDHQLQRNCNKTEECWSLLHTKSKTLERIMNAQNANTALIIVSHEWPGFSAGVKFNPSDVELLLNVEWEIQNRISVIHGVNLSLLDTTKTW